MEIKFPLQKFNKKTVAVVSISTVVAVSAGIFKLVPLFLKEPPPIPKPGPKPNPPLPIPEPEPEFNPIPNSTKISKICEAIIYCKISEEIYSTLTSEDDHLSQKRHLKQELNRIFEDYKFWQKVGFAEAISNCIENKVTCDCFNPYLERYCPN